MFSGLQKEMRRAYAAAGMLFELHLDLLYHCDLECIHCYLDDKRRPILPTEFWSDVLDQAASLGVISVTLSGGEIFLRKDLFELIAHARALGIFVHLKTHGGHIDAARASRIAALSVSSVSLSYYATDPQIHDEITQRPGSQARTRAAFEHLIAAGVPTIASYVAMDINRNQLEAVSAECAALGVSLRLTAKLLSAHSGHEFPKRLALRPDDLRAFEAHVAEQERVKDAPVRSSNGAAGEDAKNCAAGHLALYVSAEGQVRPCVSWPMPIGDLTHDTLASIWHGSPALAAVQRQRQRDRTVCRSCEVRAHCEFCPGQAWLQTGDPMAALQEFCWRTRAKTLARAAARGEPEPALPAGLRGASIETGHAPHAAAAGPKLVTLRLPASHRTS